MEDQLIYRDKYIKYKKKYLDLVEQLGGIIYKPGEYIFFYNSSIINENKGHTKEKLSTLEHNNKLAKVDYNKITDEIGNNNGWYYVVGSKEWKKIQSSTKIVSKKIGKTGTAIASTSAALASKAHKSVKGAVSKAREQISNQVTKMKEASHESYCKKCEESCNLHGGSLSSSIPLPSELLNEKNINEEYIKKLAEILEQNEISVDRAIHGKVGVVSSSIINFIKL